MVAVGLEEEEGVDEGVEETTEEASSLGGRGRMGDGVAASSAANASAVNIVSECLVQQRSGSHDHPFGTIGGGRRRTNRDR